MRIPHSTHRDFGQPNVVDVELNPECRDPLVPVLRGLQHLYSVPDLRDRLLQLVEQDVSADVDPELGREGFSYWQITVLAAVRLGCNFTYDHLQDLAENHRALMQILQVGDWHETSFNWQRIRDNVCLLSDETVEQMNWLIVEAGHRLHPEACERIRGDAFVADTNVHYPTESSLILDGLRKILDLGRETADVLCFPGWRQSKSLKKKAKKIARDISRIGKGRDYQIHLRAGYQKLFRLAELVLSRTQELVDHLFTLGTPQDVLPACEKLMYWHDVTHHVMTTAQRRIVDGETVPNEDKIFSLFEPDTELIKRGKVKQPFGHSILVIEDAIGFICDYKIVPLHVEDRDILIPQLRAMKTRLAGDIHHASFDRGFHSPEIQTEAAKIITHPCIPMTGVHKTKKQEEEATIEFRQARQRHPGIESAIGALQTGNGLARCRDRSSPGFKRYIGLGILGRNLHTLGKLLLAAEYPHCAAATTRRKQVA